MPFFVIAFVILIVVIIVCRSRAQQNSSSNPATDDYRNDEEKFKKTLLTRNYKRLRHGETRCIVCGEYSGNDIKRTFNPWRRNGTLCEHCDRWMRSEFRKEYDASTQKDPQLLLIMQEKVVRCLAIALDVSDGIITESCAEADINAAKRFEDEKYQRTLRNKSADEKGKSNQYAQQEADRKSANEILRRLS